MPQYPLTFGTMLANDQFTQSIPVSLRSPGNGIAPYFQGGGATPATIPHAQTAPGNSAQQQAASAAPWDPRVSPLPLLVVMLLVGILGLRFIHWRQA